MLCLVHNPIDIQHKLAIALRIERLQLRGDLFLRLHLELYRHSFPFLSIMSSNPNNFPACTPPRFMSAANRSIHHSDPFASTRNFGCSTVPSFSSNPHPSAAISTL